MSPLCQVHAVHFGRVRFFMFATSHSRAGGHAFVEKAAAAVRVARHSCLVDSDFVGQALRD